MAQNTIAILIPETSLPPGPIGVARTFVGQKQQAASYYLAGRDLQTVSWHVPEQFAGVIQIQASISADPQTDSEWFNVYVIDTDLYKNGFYNLYGNYVWMRASVINWTNGSINLVAASY